MKSFAKQQASQCEQAIVSGDFESVVAFTYPRVIELQSGKEAMIRGILRLLGCINEIAAEQDRSSRRGHLG